ncbi:hypothetical protein [Listeria booriae]|uniref:hypothetical protein n=1 Tax=Listeria booriae TaxID=1552123 RepID=UPI0016252068|nr:hypothetical protein [Listeria booriae]MBC2303381.1 hypothetical protein [Listeria booriae]
MAYVDYDFYTAIYFGEEIEVKDFPKLEAKARDKIDEITFYRVQKKGLDSFSEFVQTQIKKAVCAQIEYFIELGGTTAVAVNNADTVNIGRTAMKANEFASTALGTDARMICSDARAFLSATGLLYSGIGVV